MSRAVVTKYYYKLLVMPEHAFDLSRSQNFYVQFRLLEVNSM